ncbi:MAG: RDD family protein [Desulfuromonadaceae bacterium]|nr:RDD family protein [Desulfuromonadaceae bacterium]
MDSLADRRLIFVRVSACFADGAVLLLIFLGFVLLAELAIRGSSGRPLFLTQAARLADLMIPYFFLFFFVCFGYFTFFHFFSGQTPGKMLCGLRVVDEHGKSLDLGQAFLRSAAGLLSLLMLGAGYWIIFFDPQGKSWNDRLAGTQVIRTDQNDREV